MPGRSDGTRAIALVGPGGAGKTSLAEALLFAAGTIDRQGSVDAGTSVGDASAESRSRAGSTELNLMHFDFMDDHFVILDSPGSIGFAADGAMAVAAADLAIVVVDPEADRAILAEPMLRQLEAVGVPHLIFVNKIDQARVRVEDLLAALQPISSTPLVARQLPIWKDDHVAGFIDLALERAFVYRTGQPSEQVDIPDDLKAEEADARFHMLEQMSDFDDELMEQLLSDVTPSRDAIFADLVQEIRDGQITPVFFGSAQNGFGVRRLLRARHELRMQTPAKRVEPEHRQHQPRQHQKRPVAALQVRQFMGHHRRRRFRSPFAGAINQDGPGANAPAQRTARPVGHDELGSLAARQRLQRRALPASSASGSPDRRPA